MVRQVMLTIACAAVVGCGAESSFVGFAAPLKGSGVVKSQTVEVTPFEKIDVASALTLKLKQEEPASVTIEADDNLLPLVKTQFKNGEFSEWIDSELGLSPTKPILVSVSTPKVSSVRLSGACAGESEKLSSESLFLETSGASSFTAALQVKKLVGDSSGASWLQLSGSAEQVKIDLSGASHFKGADLTCVDVAVDTSGASNAVFHATGSVKASASGASIVRYVGDPASVTKTETGASSIGRQ
jgi:hypothetical protein